MKKLLLLAILWLVVACGSKDAKPEPVEKTEATSEKTPKTKALSIETDRQFGEDFESTDVTSKSDLLATYRRLSPGDTVQVQFQSEVRSVCAKKGCWMTMDLGEEESTHVTFKDYGFFVPKDSKGHQMLVNGLAFIEHTDVETLKHYAEDAGKSEADIAQITEPELNFRMIAEGVKTVE